MYEALSLVGGGDGKVLVRKVSRTGEVPAEVTLEEASQRGVDLIVMYSHPRSYVSWLVQGSQAERVAQSWPTLVLREGVRGFVDAHSGAVSLARILLPLDPNEDPTPVYDALVTLIQASGAPQGVVNTVSIGENAILPRLPGLLPEGWVFEPVLADGDPLTVILNLLKDHYDVVVMATRGHDSIGDALWGSRTERVLHASSCPVLIVPGA